MLLTRRVSSFHYSMGSGTTETKSRHLVREPRIAALSRALSWPKTNLGYKIRVLDLSESLAYICTYETLFPYGWKPYKYGRK